MVVIAILVIIIKYTLEDVSLVLWPTNFFLVLSVLHWARSSISAHVWPASFWLAPFCLAPIIHVHICHSHFSISELLYQPPFVVYLFYAPYETVKNVRCEAFLYKNNIAIVWKTGGVFDLEFRKNGFHLKKITCL